MFDLIATVLAFFYRLVHSYGLAIVLLTIAVMAVTSPLTYKGTKSMIQMQRLQPQMKAIQAKYRDDREKMNQEMLAFYKANNVNPVGGCLPMLIQIPVFIVLYRVVRGLTARVTDIGMAAGFNAMNLRVGRPFGAVPENVEHRSDFFNPAYVSKDEKLWRDLHDATEMNSWGIDLSESASKALSRSFGHALPYLILIAVVLVTGVIQQRQIQGRQAKSGSTTPINSQQQMIMKIMPFFLPVFSFGVPAALVVYFVVSNLWRIGQQSFITRTLYSGHHHPPAEPIDVAEVEAPKSSGNGGAKAREPKKPASGPSPARSPMGRNRRADGATPDAKRSRPAPKPKPKPKPERTPTTSGRVTPPGSGASRSRKKKRT
jgi:YidC/Oxa1 family membrane protein insertase